MKIQFNILRNNYCFKGENSGKSKINTVYYNDLHASTRYVESFLEERDTFYKEHKDETNLTLCGGDMFLDYNKNNETIAKKLAVQTDASCIGNHDLESGNLLAKIINKFDLKDKFLSTNIKYSKETPLNDAIIKSKILEINGEKIGVTGVSPTDFANISYINKNTNFIKTEQIDETVKSVRKEVEKLENENINKIFLLAHTGNYDKSNGDDFYKKLANIGGIDVIIGGHDHIETDRWETSERNEPVKVVATGKSSQHGFGENLDYAGFLNLEFDENGVLIKDKCKNSVKKLKLKHIDTEDDAIHILKAPLTQTNRLTGHSEMGNIATDATLWYVNKNTKGEKADFAIINPGSIRDNFDDIYITPEDINNALPFTSGKITKANITKEQLIKTLNYGALTSSYAKISPGAMQVSGLEYTINPDYTVSDVHILNDDGSVKYDLDDFDDETTFIMAYDSYLASGLAGLIDIKKDIHNDKNIEIFNCTRQQALFEYLTTSDKITDYTQIRIHKNEE